MAFDWSNACKTEMQQREAIEHANDVKMTSALVLTIKLPDLLVVSGTW